MCKCEELCLQNAPFHVAYTAPKKPASGENDIMKAIPSDGLCQLGPCIGVPLARKIYV